MRSYAFRCQGLYKFALGCFPRPQLREGKDRLDILMLTMCGKKHLLMLECCLFSMGRFWKRLPALKVVSDGTMPKEKIAKKLSWWPQPVEVVDWGDYLTGRAAETRPELAAFAKKHVLGRKLLVLVEEAEKGPVLWCDSDILFYGDFTCHLPHELPSRTFVFSTEEIGAGGYDPALLQEGLGYLTEKPRVNTGILLCAGNFYDECGLAPFVQKGLAACYGVTEQTIMAHAVHQTGEVRWGTNVVEIVGTDQLYLSPVGVIHGGAARHYYSGFSQHMFWRDALGMRMGRFPEISA
jgi:hypothetical protein